MLDAVGGGAMWLGDGSGGPADVAVEVDLAPKGVFSRLLWFYRISSVPNSRRGVDELT